MEASDKNLFKSNYTKKININDSLTCSRTGWYAVQLNQLIIDTK